MLVAQEVIPATGHTEVIDVAVSATCATTGLTEGSHCSRCLEVFVEQNIIDKTEHIEKDNTGICKKCNGVMDAYKVLIAYIKKNGQYNANLGMYQLTYTSSDITYRISYYNGETGFYFGSSNSSDHNYSCSVTCNKGSSTQEVSMRYADNGSNTPWGLIRTSTFSSSSPSLTSYQYSGFNSSRASYYRSVLSSKVATTLSGVSVMLRNTNTGVTLAMLGFTSF